MIGFIRQYVYSVYTAEDILQETYLEALKHAERIQDPTKLMAWLRTVSKRLAIKEVTRENKLTKKLSCLFFFSSFSIEDVVINRIYVMDLLNEVLKQFPSCYRKIVYYREACTMSYAQIAKELGMNSVAIRKAHSRVMKALRKKIHQELDP